MEIRTFGVGGRMRECEKILLSCLDEKGGRLLLLPIPTSRDKKYITDTDRRAEEILPLISEDTLVVGYNIPDGIRLTAEDKGAAVYDAALDESFLLQNARLTANGALGYILTRFDRDVADLSFALVGYGRIGKEMLRLLLLLGTSVTLLTTREAVALELLENGVGARVITPDIDLCGFDVLINTAPARLFLDENLPAGLDIIDLASGSNFEPSERLVKLPSIPDKAYPISAGRLYAEGVLRFLESEGRV